MAILVTGGLGVNGAFTLRRLVSEAEKPICFDSSPDTSFVRDIITNIEIVRGDIQSLDSLIQACRKYNVESVIHIAAVTSDAVLGNDPTKARPVEGFEINARGSLNVLEAARLTNVKRVIYTSTKGVYGSTRGTPRGYPTYEPTNEECPTRPWNLYNSTKLFGEHLGGCYSDIYGLEFASLRFSTIYGPGKTQRYDPAYYPLDNMVVSAVSGTHCKIVGKPDMKDDFLYVKDVAKGIVQAVRAKSLPNRVYNISSGQPRLITDAVIILKRLVPEASIELVAGDPARQGQSVLDNTKARQDLGFSPDFDLESGLSDYVRWLSAKEVVKP